MDVSRSRLISLDSGATELALTTVFVALRSLDAYSEKGRLIFALLHTLVSAGFKVQWFDKASDCDLGEYGEMAVALPGVTPTSSLSFLVCQDMVLLMDQEDPRLICQTWAASLRLRFDIESKGLSSDLIWFPYPIHPVHLDRGVTRRLGVLRVKPKRSTVFFSGDMKGYRQSRVTFPERKIPRTEVIEIVTKSLRSRVDLCQDMTAVLDRMSGGGVGRVVLVDTSKVWIDDRLWPDLLAEAAFFLAPPGIVMPMCHNIIEAMAVGAIPITSYPEWFKPRLVDGENCLTYFNHKDLVSAVDRALSMSQAERERMSRRVMDYYDTHLAPEAFVRRLTAVGCEAEIMMISEKAVARSAQQISWRSWLVSDTPRGQLISRRLNYMFLELTTWIKDAAGFGRRG